MSQVLPSGTVTFLFTDIESSSQRWESDPSEMRAVLHRHDEILRDAVASYGGVIFKHLGDGMCAAFGSASSGLAAAVTAQGALHAESWPGGERLLVRMGVHTGEAEPRDGDYFGPPLNRAARVMGAANGGQIVCSGATAALCRDIVLVDAGEHELRGVGLERLHLVVGDGYEADQRPLRLSDRFKSNLPPRLTSFVGRDSDVTELVDAVEAHRLVTLVGVGGVGKTSLAIAAAREVGDRFPDGVWLCELAALGDPRTVPPAVAEAIGSRVQPGMNMVDSIVNYLDGRQALIVLDNCEHVLEAASRLAERMASASGKVTVLATSRAPLGARGELLWSVNPLDAPTSGVTLFSDRAHDRSQRFQLDDQNRATVEEICRRLDGIPLAIELAAARVRAMSPAAIAERLDDRFRLLRGGRRGERHETLHDTIQWSYDLLAEPAAALFDRLCVFAGGFTIASAEQACADEEVVDELDVLDLVTTLVDNSMITAEPSEIGDRYRILETLRQYGTANLSAAGQLDTYQQRHSHYYHDLALQQNILFWSPAEPEVWRTLEAEWENLRAAFAHAATSDDVDTAADIVASLGWYSVWSGRDELCSGAERLLARAGFESHPGYADVCAVAAWGAFNRVELRQAVSLAEQALTAREVDREGLCRISQMAAYVNLGDEAATRSAYANWVQNATHSPKGVQAHPENMMALYLARMQGSVDADTHSQRGMELALESGCPSAISYAHMCRGWVLALAQPDAAAAAFQRSIEIGESLSPRHNLCAFARRGLADLVAKDGELVHALAVCREALQVAVDNHHLIVAGQLLAPVALVLDRAGNSRAAMTLLACLQAHGHQPSAGLNIASSHHAGEVGEDARKLTIRQAAQMAIEFIDAALDDSSTDSQVPTANNR